MGKGTITSFSCAKSSNGYTPTASDVMGLNGEQFTETNGSTGWVHTNVFANGALLATYHDTNLYFAFNDWLGTKRGEGEILSGSTCVNTYFSLAYGNDLTTLGGGCPDATEHHFTGKERDSESGNDYFKYRYYASSMGRWLSPDPSMFTHVDFGNPQSLNLYNYVGNRPLTLTDLDGLCWQGFQWACNIVQRFQNFHDGFGFQTDNQILTKPNKRSQRKVEENRRVESLSKQPYKPTNLQLPPGPYVRPPDTIGPIPPDTIGPAPIPKKPEPPGWYECLVVPGEANSAYAESRAAATPSDSDATANGIGSESIRLDLNGKGYKDQGNYNAAVKFNAAAGALDYGVNALGCAAVAR